MQKLVKTVLCVGVVSVSLIACEDDTIDKNIIDLDQIDNQIFNLDSLVHDTIDLNNGIDIERAGDSANVENIIQEEV